MISKGYSTSMNNPDAVKENCTAKPLIPYEITAGLRPVFREFLRDPTKRTLVLSGGRASGKTGSALRVLLSLTEAGRGRVHALREYESSMQDSIFADLKQILMDHDDGSHWPLWTVQRDRIINRVTGSEWRFSGYRVDPFQIKGSVVTGGAFFLIEEGASITAEQYGVIEGTAARVPPNECKIIILLNPGASTDWIMRQIADLPASWVHRHINFDENDFLSAETRAAIEASRRGPDDEEWSHTYLGVPRSADVRSFLSADLIRACIGVRQAHTGRWPAHAGTQPRAAVGLDVSDQGRDGNAAAVVVDGELIALDQWSGRGLRVKDTVERCIRLADDHGAAIRYDVTGIGVAAREALAEKGRIAHAFLAGGAVPFASAPMARSAGVSVARSSALANARVAAWSDLRDRLRNTVAFAQGDSDWSSDQLLSISPALPERLLAELIFHLTIPHELTKGAKAQLESKPAIKSRGMPSPDLGDALAIAACRMEVDHILQTIHQGQNDANHQHIHAGGSGQAAIDRRPPRPVPRPAGSVRKWVTT